MHHSEPSNTFFVQAGQYSLSPAEQLPSITQTILGISHGSVVVHFSYRYVIRYVLMHALRASRRSMQADRW